MGRRRLQAAIFVLFLMVAVLMTWPLAAHLGDAARDLGDPLLNSWILAWDQHRLASGELSGFFDANIFFPYHRTLAYSEYLLTQALLTLPVHLLGGSPILVHNLALLLGLATSGFGMFLLAREVTGYAPGAVVAGLVYAFSAFMIGHLSHLQVLWAGGLPLTLLFLQRFLADRSGSSSGSGSGRNLGLFCACFVFQCLANGYYAVYLGYIVVVIVLYYALTRRTFRDVAWWRRLLFAAVLIAAVLGPMFYPYVALRRELGFKRWLDSGASWSAFRQTAPGNRFWGERFMAPRRPEHDLFPGLTAVSLAVVGLLLKSRGRTEPSEGPSEPGPTRARLWIQRALDGAVVLAAAAVAVIAVHGRLGFGAYVTATTLKSPVLLLAITLVARQLARGAWREPFPRAWSERELRWMYLVMTVGAVFLTLGKDGPYDVLFRYVPGFDGLRIAARLQVVVLLGLAVLAAFGVSEVAQRSRRAGALVAAVASLFVLVESFGAPLPLAAVPSHQQAPAVYHWLAAQPGDFGVAELPLPASTAANPNPEYLRIYYSTLHWKRLFNGWSGYLSPLYHELLVTWHLEPLAENIETLRRAGVRYVILHEDAYRSEGRRRQLRQSLRALPRVRPIGRFGEASVYELLPSPR